MKVCSKCGKTKDETEYFLKNQETGRLHAQCKLCYKEHRKTYQIAHYKRYRQDYLVRAKRRRQALRMEYRVNMLAYLQGKACSLCGESDIRTFEFDHLKPIEKSFSISQAVKLGYKWSDVEYEMTKCRILCANCHKKETAEQFGWYKV